MGGGGNSPRRCRGLLAETPNGVYMECAANPTPGVAGGYSRKALRALILCPGVAGGYSPYSPNGVYMEWAANPTPGDGAGLYFPLAKFFTSAVGRCPFPLAKSMMPASAGVYTPSPFMERGGADRPGERSRFPLP